MKTASMRALFHAAAAAMVAFTSVAAIAADRIYVIRHLQKAAGDDPPLSAEGAANAARLSELLAAQKVTAIFATSTRRAQQTGEPLAQRLGIAVTPYDPRKPEALAPTIAQAKGAVLVIGHSNTVADLVALVGGAKPGPMTEQDYGTIFVVESGSSDVRQITLGKP